jgi:hypothetical protein
MYCRVLNWHPIKNTAVHPRRFWASYSPPWEFEISHSVGVRKSLSIFSILSHINPVHILKHITVRSILIVSSQLRLRFPFGLPLHISQLVYSARMDRQFGWCHAKVTRASLVTLRRPADNQLVVTAGVACRAICGRQRTKYSHSTGSFTDSGLVLSWVHVGVLKTRIRIHISV